VNAKALLRLPQFHPSQWPFFLRQLQAFRNFTRERMYKSLMPSPIKRSSWSGREKFDFGIASLTESPADIQMSFLFRDRFSAVISNEPRLTHLGALPPGLPIAQRSYGKLLDRAFQSIGHVVKPRYEVARVTTAVAMAEAGLGVAILA